LQRSWRNLKAKVNIVLYIHDKICLLIFSVEKTFTESVSDSKDSSLLCVPGGNGPKQRLEKSQQDFAPGEDDVTKVVIWFLAFYQSNRGEIWRWGGGVVLLKVHMLKYRK